MLQECKKEIEYLHAINKCPYLSIKGLLIKEDETCEQAVTNFFKNTMKITEEISIKSAYKQGNMVKVKLTDLNDKSVIFKNAKNLKDVKNSNGDPFQIRDELTSKKYEEKMCRRQLVRENFNRGRDSTAVQLEMSFKKGKFMVNSV